MCKLKKYHGTSNTQIDKCMKILIENLNEYFGDDLDILACCCGHGKYPLSVIVKEYPNGRIYDFCSNLNIPRKRRFYIKDNQGYYYIPEVVKNEAKRIIL